MSRNVALVVDDSPSARYALRKLLEAQGYRAEAVASGDAARDWLAAAGRVDVIFLDHIMPGADGFQVLAELKGAATTVSIPVVICSSHEDDPSFVPQARARGAVDVLDKPPSPERLKAVLQRLEQEAAARVAEAPAHAAAVPGKVQPIRTPEEAIGQRVMQSLREALSPAEASPAAAAVPPAPLAEAPPPAGDRGLREQLDGRLRKLSQDFYAQLGDLKAHVAGLDSLADPERLRELIREEVRAAIAGLREELLQAVRTEARAESDRTVMDAAGRISDQVAQSLARAMAQKAAAGR